MKITIELTKDQLRLIKQEYHSRVGSSSPDSIQILNLCKNIIIATKSKKKGKR